MTREIHAILFGTSLTTKEFYEVTDKLLNLFNVMNKELAFCECTPNTDIYNESVTKCNKKVTTLRTK